MASFSIRHKLLLSFIGIALLSVPFNIYLIVNFSKVTKNLIYLTDYHLPSLQALLEMKNTVLRINLFISNFNHTVDQIEGNESTPTPIGATKDQLLAYLEEIGEWQKIYQQHLLPIERSSQVINQLTQLKNDVVLKSLGVFAGKEKNLSDLELKKEIAALEQAQAQLEHFINTQLDTEAEALEVTKNKTTKATHLFQILVIAASVFVLSFACFIGFILSRWISTPIIALRNFTYSINQDNLNIRTLILGKDEIGELGASINQMLENLSLAKTQIIEASRLAGIAEVATSVIHNVGNVLNSVNTSVSLIIDAINRSKITLLPQLYEIIYTNKNNLDYFLNNDKRGKLVLPYFQELLQALEQERINIREELNCLRGNLNQIEQVVTMQLSSEVSLGMVESLNISKLIEDALSLQETKINYHNIHIIRQYKPLAPFFSVKSKLQQILVNLIKNAIEALIEGINQEKQLIIEIEKITNNRLRLKIKDNGIGILKENLSRIFSFGFTTKIQGHGYGLHGCALLATELGGTLSVESDGLRQGATFVLDIPNLAIAH